MSRRKVVRFGEGPLGFVIDGDERGRVIVRILVLMMKLERLVKLKQMQKSESVMR
jgi:hypothetical protein